MHNISTECLFSFITNPPGGYPPEIHRKSTGNDSGKRPESFKFWCLESEEEDVKDGREGRGWGKGVMEMEKSRGIC